MTAHAAGPPPGRRLRRPLSLAAGLWPVLLVMVLVVTVGSMAVWQQAIHHRVEDLRSERFRFSLVHVKSVLEAGLRLGNSTADLPGAQALIRSVRDRQPDILSIDIYDAQGDVLFSTDPGGLGLKLPAAWNEPCLRAESGQPWKGQDADGGVQCAGLVNAFGQDAGSVVLRHRTAAQAAPQRTVMAELPLLSGLLVAVVLAAGWAGSRVVRPLEQSASALQRAVASAPLALPATEPSLEHFGPVSAALQALAAQEHWLAETDAEADRLDQQELA
jgi:hypothetical protein